MKKKIFSMIAGFVVPLGMFIAGVAAATLVLTKDPLLPSGTRIDVAALWTDEPRRVDKSAQNFERLPAAATLVSAKQQSLQVRAIAMSTTDASPAPAGTVTTGSVGAAANDTLAQAHELAAAHTDWCANRYRSYRPESNQYTRYDGEKWPCVSPHLKHLAADRISLTPSDAERYGAEHLPWLDASVDAGAAYVASDHVSYCFSRYRSYRPDDNTYQPYGGGPRRQCR